MANHPSAKRLLANRREGEWPAAKCRVGELSITANHPSAKRRAAKRRVSELPRRRIT